MTRTIRMLLAVTGLALFTVFQPGCTGPKQLEPGGAYAGDVLLYNVDDTYVSTRQLLDTVFKWEDSLPEGLAPKLRESMNKVRDAARKADMEFHRLRSAYRAAPTDENRKAYENALSKLVAVYGEASALYGKDKR